MCIYSYEPSDRYNDMVESRREGGHIVTKSLDRIKKLCFLFVRENVYAQLFQAKIIERLYPKGHKN